MKPLIWRNTYEIEDDGYALFRNADRKTNSYIFMGGKTLPCADVGQHRYSQDPKDYDLVYTYRYSEKHLKRFDSVPNTGQSPLVNKKVLDILNTFCPDDIQAFPATIIPEKGSKHTFENHDYWVINITKLVEAIDLEQSIVEFFEYEGAKDRIRDIKKLVFLDKQEFLNLFIARIKNDRSSIIISSSLAQAFKEANITGVQFIEDKNYGRI